jgi:phage baseplate assembly protein W
MAVPFRIVDGRVAQHSGADKIADDVRHLISTRVGERVLRRDYGGGVHSRLHEPTDHTVRTLVRHEVERALRRHLPLVRLTGPVQVVVAEPEVTIRLEYSVDPAALPEQLVVTVPRPK